MNSINDFGPFHFEVWGSVADWIMIIVTGATGIVIWLTLKSQNKLQDLQFRLARKAVKPMFEATIGYHRLSPHDNPKHTIASILLKNISENTALGFELSATGNSTEIWTIQNSGSVKRLPFGGRISYQIKGPLNSTGKTGSIHMAYQVFKFSYQDTLYNEYFLILRYSVSSGNASIQVVTEMDEWP